MFFLLPAGYRPAAGDKDPCGLSFIANVGVSLEDICCHTFHSQGGAAMPPFRITKVTGKRTKNHNLVCWAAPHSTSTLFEKRRLWRRQCVGECCVCERFIAFNGEGMSEFVLWCLILFPGRAEAVRFNSRCSSQSWKDFSYIVATLAPITSEKREDRKPAGM